jgi:hypothetical protein
MRPLGPSRVAKGTRGLERQATQGSPSRLPLPKPDESNAAIVAAIKAALDERRYERAAALLEVFRRTDTRDPVVALRQMGERARR